MATLPLDGIKILDFSDNGFVPSGAAALGDLGADVIKLERTIGDPMRRIIAQGLVPSVGGFDFMFELVNRNKRGIALDVEAPEGREVFEKLVAWADVYITNQLPRVREKLKTRPEDLFAINPTLVFAKGHGQGQKGPDAGAGGYDGVSYWARGAVAHVLTPEGSAGPIGSRPAFGDIPSGFNLAGGVCAGLVHVLRTGQGVVVDTALLNTAVWQLGPDLTYASMQGTEMPRGTGDRVIPPLMGTYVTKDGRFCSLMMIVEDNYWAQGMRALGLEEFIESHPTPEDRARDADMIRERAAAQVAGWTKAEIEERLRAESCIFSFYANPVEVIEDPQVVANGYMMEHPSGNVKLTAPPVQFDDTAHQVRRPAPHLGQHNREVLAMLGYDDAAIDAMVAAGTLVEEA
jgi:crotonobetainyl-CoA:carnitine CoA-transferase CaiB-like acyl-CoA transferase